MTHSSDERGVEMRQLFFETSQELLQLLNDEALKLEKHPADVELVRSIRRIVHTLKGDAAACGFRELSNTAHALEDALASESPSSHERLAEVAFAAADTFGAMLTAYQRKGKLPSTVSLAKMIRELSQQPKSARGTKAKAKAASAKLTKTKRSRKAAPAAAATIVPTESAGRTEPVGGTELGWTEYEKLAMQDAQSRGRNVFQVSASIDPLCLMPIAARQLVLNALKSSGEVLGIRPEANSPESSKRLELLVSSNKSAEQLTAQCRIPAVISRVSVALIGGAAPARKAAATVAVERKSAGVEIPSSVSTSSETGEEHARGDKSIHAHGENILRVDAQRIDSVLDLVGELIIGKSMLQQAFAEFARHAPKEALRGRFSDAMAFQSRVLNDLQRSVMKIRMVPVEQLFRRFPRMVRDVAKQCGKDVELVMHGQDTDLDKSLLDAIAEPLTHLVRNAISHGIESSEERVRCGNPLAAPSISLRIIMAIRSSSKFRDDGRGIDSQKIKAKAVETAIIYEEEADRLGEAGILELIFRPGLQHRRPDHRSLRARRGHGRGAKRSASPEGFGRNRDPRWTGYNLPPEAAAYAGNHSRLVV